MKIKYLGHSSFALESSCGTVIVCDPYEPSVGFAMPEISAHAVTLSHHHFDHCYAEGVSGKPDVIDRAGEYAVRDIKIRGIDSFHDEFGGARRGGNVIFKYETDGLTVCHLGDLGEDITPALTDKIGAVNVLLIPVGGTYTIDAATAKKYVDAIAPDAVIPMHYRTPESKIDIAKIDGFLALCKGVEIDNVGSEICLSTHDICGFKGKIIVMERV